MSYCLLSVAAPSAEWWPIALPLLTGGAAIYLLLPRPKAYPVLLGAGLGLVALVLAGVLLTRSGFVSVETILFWSFSVIGILSGALLVTQNNPARAALSFALVVLSTCGLFLLLAAPFLMAATTIIYAGAIIVTFLFVIMLAQQVGLSDADDRSREPLLATITGFVLLATLLFVLQRYDHRVNESAAEIDRLLEQTREVAELDTRAAMVERIGAPGEPEDLFLKFKQLYRDKHHWSDLEQQVNHVEDAWIGNGLDTEDTGTEQLKARLRELIALGEDAKHRLGWLPLTANKPLSNLSGTPPTVPAELVRRDAAGLPRMPAENSAYLGRALFTDFLLPVELGGTLLLAATIGAVAIAFRRS
ncbi:MAG TPA: NADH-quinone oxidoreductase subunit J [Gemmataceae bacterium]|jgi:NADH:ubiquinone oxidoreductase subunit 6 (subunit J)